MEESEVVFQWEETEEHGVRILRGYGTSPCVIVPAQIEGMPVKEIGSYCFSDAGKGKGGGHQSLFRNGAEVGLKDADSLDSWMRELSGKYIQRVVLPDSVEKLGNLAFYNCTGLKKLVFGAGLTEVGSDAFMNCLHLETLVVRGSLMEQNGLKQILGQRSADTQVLFQTEGQTTGAVFYPEYYEMYDEVGPAHIFALNLTGEGFRARQCFQDGVVDLEKYDRIFEQACAEESVSTLSKMALNRLFYAVRLEEAARKRYAAYIREHQEWIVPQLVKRKELELLLFLFREGYLEFSMMGMGVSLASESGWTEGAASLLRLRQTMQTQNTDFPKSGKERYSFDDF